MGLFTVATPATPRGRLVTARATPGEANARFEASRRKLLLGTSAAAFGSKSTKIKKHSYANFDPGCTRLITFRRLLFRALSPPPEEAYDFKQPSPAPPQIGRAHV